MNRKITFVLLVWAFSVSALMSQNALSNKKELFGASPESAVETPKNVAASDGLYDRYVLVRWEGSENATRYKVFRTDRTNGGSLQEISNSWQQGTWLCDYTALPGVPYYYTVMASNGNMNSKTSAFDKGFVKKNNIVESNQQDLTSSNRELYGNPNFVVLMPKTIATDKPSYKIGDAVHLIIKLENINKEPSRTTEIRCFLSKNVTLDWYDKVLSVKSLASVPANATLTVQESVVLPSDILVGDYYLIIVSSSEGDILNSRSEAVKINLKR
jgi:hypothetical protein